MSEEIPAILSEHVPEPSLPSASLGEALRMARQRRGLEVEEVARQLRMSSRQVTALEADEFVSLPSPTFTRGFIRNYARLLEVEPEPLLAKYSGMLPASTTGASISLHSEDIPILVGSRNIWISYLIASIVLGIAAGAWWTYMDWREKASAQQPAVSSVAPATTTSAPAQPPAQAVPEPASPPPTSVVLPGEQEQSPSPAPVATEGNHILMKFSQQSWVRVLDRDGKEIFNKNKPENTEDVAEGNPPFKVEIGNAAGVQLSYKGQPVDLAPHTKANVARLTLE